MKLWNKALINGEFIVGEQEQYPVYNPANMTEIASCDNFGRSDAEFAVSCASLAFNLFSKTLAKERALLLRKLAELIRKNKDEFAKVIVLENGKVMRDAYAEIEYATAFIEWFAEEARRVYGAVIPSVKQGQRLFSIKQPVGVVAAITPWNFPLAMIARKLAPAIAAGCTIVIKPSEETPLTAYFLGKLCVEADIPKGVVNILSGEAKEIGAVMTSDSRVRLLTFTGSTAVGKFLMAQSSSSVKKIALELGGNAPFIVFEDADLKKAADGLLASKLRNGGQSCICANRVYVHKSVLSDFINLIKQRVASIVVGDGNNSKSQLGPMINQQAIEKVKNLLDDSVRKNGEILYQMDISEQLKKSPRFCAPTIIINHSLDADIERAEIFAPIISLFSFDNENEVIERANATNYRLASYVYSENQQRIWRVSERLEYGMVGVNDVAISSEVANFGGVKESGLGREGGSEGISEYLETKYIAIS